MNRAIRDSVLGSYRDKLVAMTGSTGLNGSYLVKALVDAGARVRAIVHKRPANEFTKLADEVLQVDLMDARQQVRQSGERRL